jgi:hypothetical protein
MLIIYPGYAPSALTCAGGDANVARTTKIKIKTMLPTISPVFLVLLLFIHSLL